MIMFKLVLRFSTRKNFSCFDKKIVFIMDESNVLDFVCERMKTLLANGEVRREGGKEEERE